jgi:hypothetical protein
MALTSIQMKDFNGASRAIAARQLAGGGAYYQAVDPPVTVYRWIVTGTSGDAQLISATPVVLRAVRIVNDDAVMIHAKFYNSSSAPTAGAGTPAYSASAQSGMNNPDPRLSGGGMEFSSGLGMTVVTGIANNNSTSVTAAKAIIEVEYHAL